jgi:choline transport protein
MDHDKEDIVRHAEHSNSFYADEVESVSAQDGAFADRQDMLRMGKLQETQRNFRHITILAFVTVILAIWENILSTAVFALGNGGTAGLIWGYLFVMVGFGFVTASLAEMASM